MLSIAGKHLSGGFLAAHRAFSAAAEAVKKLYVGNIAWASECPALGVSLFCKKAAPRTPSRLSVAFCSLARERKTHLLFETKSIDMHVFVVGA